MGGKCARVAPCLHFKGPKSLWENMCMCPMYWSWRGTSNNLQSPEHTSFERHLKWWLVGEFVICCMSTWRNVRIWASRQPCPHHTLWNRRGWINCASPKPYVSPSAGVVPRYYFAKLYYPFLEAGSMKYLALVWVPYPELIASPVWFDISSIDRVHVWLLNSRGST